MILTSDHRINILCASLSGEPGKWIGKEEILPQQRLLEGVEGRKGLTAKFFLLRSDKVRPKLGTALKLWTDYGIIFPQYVVQRRTIPLLLHTEY